MRSTKKEIKALHQFLADAAGSKEKGLAALNQCRQAVGERVTVSEYRGGSWSASWFEGHGQETRWREINITPSEIVNGLVPAIVRGAIRGA